MGGSGGGGNFDPPKVRSDLRDLEREISDAEYEAQVAHLLATVLAKANDRDTDGIDTHLTEIKRAIEREVAGFVDLLFGGSALKQTYVAGVSDVDALVVLNESNLAGRTPREVCDFLVGRLRERFPSTNVKPDGCAVSVEFSDGVVELVPVQRRGDDYLLPNADCSAWTRVRPRAFTDALTAANRNQNGKLVPTIKLAKIALTEMPESRRPSGYHLESLALDAFAEYSGSTTPKAMLTHFFEKAADRVREPMPDRTGQSRNVDDYLGPSMSLERQVLSDSLGRIGRRLRNADGAHSIDQWKRVLGAG